MFLSGIDEAGLGPVLGPYCLGMSSFEIEEEEKTSLYKRLSGLVGNSPGDMSPVVCDSKKLYTPQRGLAKLEESVLSFFCLLHSPPKNFHHFLSKLMDQSRVDSLKNTPWYNGIKELTLPLCDQNRQVFENSPVLKTKLEDRGVRLSSLELGFVPALEFNRLLKKYKNKGTLCQSVMFPLLSQALENPETRITVDRQGGRRYYGDWLIDLLPGQPLQAERETPECSVYRSGKREIGFYVKGDSRALETALASLFAKYSREVGMRLFNNYWQTKSQKIKKTAGYYTDGQRFIKDLARENLIPENRDILVRAK